MSYLVSTLTSCETVQKMLFDAADPQFTRFDFTKNRENPNFLQYVVSPGNTSGITQSVVPGGGRTRTVRVVYAPRYLESEVKTDLTEFDCTASTAIGDLSETYSIDEDAGVLVERQIDLTELHDKCQSDEFYLMRTINQMIDAAIRKMATITAQEAALLEGNFNTLTGIAAGDPLVVQTKNASGQFINDALTQIDLAFEEMELPPALRPILFGAKDWSEYFRNLQHGCCSDAQAINLGTFANEFSLAFRYSSRIHKALNADPQTDTPLAIGVIPGAVQLLQFNEFDGERGIRMIDTETEKAGLITDPMTGITFDYYAKYDCRKWNIVIKTAHQLVGMPDDMFCDGDSNNGVNGVWNFQVNNP